MTDTTLYGIRNCDTMKKARAWPAMVRRPVLEIGEHLLVGFDGQTYACMLTGAGRARYARATLADQDVQ
jgi:arsenate reductase-like glutaredoxin family protein